MEERLPRRPESTGEGRSSDAETLAANDDGAGRETTRRRTTEERDAMRRKGRGSDADEMSADVSKRVFALKPVQRVRGRGEQRRNDASVGEDRVTER